MLTTREVADYCKVTPDTVRRWHREGKLMPEGRSPRTWLYTQSAVDIFLSVTNTKEESTVVRDQLNAILGKHRRTG